MGDVYEFHYTRHKIGEFGGPLHRPADVYSVAIDYIGDNEKETLAVFILDCKNRLMGVTKIVEGSVSNTSVRVGEVFRDAVRMNGSGIIAIHNHPSGDPTPSPDDLHLTAELIAAGRILDIPVLDHLIVTANSYVSLRDRGIAFDRG